MSADADRTFEFTSTVTFHEVGAQEIEAYAAKLAVAVRAVLESYEPVTAFLVEPDATTSDITYGVRVVGVEPNDIEVLADEILDKAVTLVAERDGVASVEAEREESLLVLTR